MISFSCCSTVFEFSMISMLNDGRPKASRVTSNCTIGLANVSMLRPAIFLLTSVEGFDSREVCKQFASATTNDKQLLTDLDIILRPALVIIL